MSDHSMPWVEKYRPKSLSEVTSQSTTTNVLQKSLHSANLPHLLFYGPAGTGKTSTVLALARELYGPNLMKSRILELNASDERGISIVRDRIKKFARLAVSNPTAEDLEKYPCPPYKLIILDEADSMTTDAQSALRRTMENYAGVTRFCLICNYVTRIIDPLASRCSKFRFKSLDEELGVRRLQYIAQQENVEVSESTLREILEVCEGDLRRGVNLLQCVSTVLLEHGLEGNIKQLFGHLPSELVDEMISVIQEKDLTKVLQFTENKILKQGYSATFVFNALHDQLLLSDTGLALSLTNNTKNNISRILWEADRKICGGGNESIQVLDCLFKLSDSM
ncbi:replication factor C subunit 2 [Martiniozyma asiatica (nom. inval.)]|nr:replication factor C subunit 2 [Martiniozyma asiatica]